jgi:chromosomal replication initiation ATPase DnaA
VRRLKPASAQAGQETRRGYTLTELITSVCRAYGMTEKQMNAPGKGRQFSEVRVLAALFVRESSEISLTELGKLVNRDIVPLRRVAQRLLNRAARGTRLMSRIEDVRSELLESQKV